MAACFTLDQRHRRERSHPSAKRHRAALVAGTLSRRDGLTEPVGQVGTVGREVERVGIGSGSGDDRGIVRSSHFHQTVVDRGFVVDSSAVSAGDTVADPVGQVLANDRAFVRGQHQSSRTFSLSTTSGAESLANASRSTPYVASWQKVGQWYGGAAENLGVSRGSPPPTPHHHHYHQNPLTEDRPFISSKPSC
jgi:hypothetical protein